MAEHATTGPKLDRRAIFEFCIVQLLEKFRERALKEIETLKRDPTTWDGEASLEVVSAGDFVRQMESLGIVSFGDSLPEGQGFEPLTENASCAGEDEPK